MSKFGNVSAEGGFDQSEIDFVTRLISSGQATIDEVANTFGVDRDVVQSVYNDNTPTQTQEDGLFNNLLAANNVLGSIGDIYANASVAPAAPVSNQGYQSPYALNAAEQPSVNLGQVAGGTNKALQGLRDFNLSDGAASADVFAGGLGSVVSAIGGKESKSETAALGALSALGLINPAAALAYRIFDAMDFFGGGGLEATPMTPEEAAKYAGETRLDQAVAQFAEGGEGAGEFLLDAIDQAKAANVEPEKIAETLNSRGEVVADLINLTVGSNEMFVADAAETAAAQAASQAAADAAMGGGDQAASQDDGAQAASQDDSLDIFQDTTASDLDLNLPQAREVFTYDKDSNVFISNTTGESFPAGDVNDVDIRDGGVYSVRPVLGSDGQVVAEHVVDESGQDIAKVDQVDGKAILRVIPNLTNVFDTNDAVATVTQGTGDTTTGDGDLGDQDLGDKDLGDKDLGDGDLNNGDLGDGGLGDGGNGTDFDSARDTNNTGVTLTVGDKDTETINEGTDNGTDDSVTTGTEGTEVVEGTGTRRSRQGGGDRDLFAAIQNTPMTRSMLFMPQMRELDNVTLGMFDAFLKASGGRS